MAMAGIGCSQVGQHGHAHPRGEAQELNTL
jgi:hypothetical protein